MPKDKTFPISMDHVVAMPRRFFLNRRTDATGVSGTGIVAEGVQFSNGKCALTWLTQYTSYVFYDSIEHVEAIHGHGGSTIVDFYDAKAYRPRLPYMPPES